MRIFAEKRKPIMKPEHKALIYARAENAITDLYHNATPNYPRELYGRSAEYFQSWFEGAAEFEVEYLRGGGAYGKNYQAALAAPCNAGRYKSKRAQEYYVAKGMRDMALEREHCGTCSDGTPNNAMWEYLSEFGTLYSYGQGGRTLAPENLVKTSGRSSFGLRAFDASDQSIAYCVRLIQIVESFNHYVKAWCDSVPEMWREHCAEEDAQALAAKRAAAARKGKETRERHYWACRDVATV